MGNDTIASARIARSPWWRRLIAWLHHAPALSPHRDGQCVPPPIGWPCAICDGERSRRAREIDDALRDHGRYVSPRGTVITVVGWMPTPGDGAPRS